MRKLYTIGSEIRQDWENIHYSAVPYLNALSDLESVDDPFRNDAGRSIVAYFLANAITWRGETARRIKKELRSMLK